MDVFGVNRLAAPLTAFNHLKPFEKVLAFLVSQMPKLNWAWALHGHLALVASSGALGALPIEASQAWRMSSAWMRR